MNPVERTIRRVDKFQQRHTPAAFVFGIVKKFGDDHGGVLVSNLGYSAFVSLFPLLLVLVTILGIVASVDPSFRTDALDAVDKQLPIFGTELTDNVQQLQRSSVIGLIVGLLVLIYGATGLAQAGLFTMAQVWNLPGPDRPGYLQRLGRAMLFLCLLGGGVIATTLLVSLNSYVHNAVALVVIYYALAVAVNVGMYIGAFRVLTPKGVPTRSLLPGAVAGGVCWTLLQLLGTYLVHHFLHSGSAYGVFAIVLGLLAWIFLATKVVVYCAEINVVLERRLWPRSIVQPPLTEADRAAMALQALQNQRRPEQHVEVTFNDRKPGRRHRIRAPRTPDEVSPPAQAPVPGPRGSLDQPDGRGTAAGAGPPA